jgi:branched-chain amino acid transport system substrate-binding protein
MKKIINSKGTPALSRRDFLRLSAGAAAALSLGACGQTVATPAPESPATEPAVAATEPAGGATGGRAIKLGYVTPKTGPLAPFGEADEFILGAMRKFFENGLDISGTSHPLEILEKDSQSDPNRAAEVAADLILQDEIDIMLVSSTPETTNPVSDQCEANGTPCISTVAPWQPWFFRKPDAAEKGYKWGYHYFWGLEDIIAVFTSIWDSLDTNKVVGALWPNDGDGLAWSSDVGFPPALEAAGYKLIDPGRYENLKDDFSAEISLFKENNVEIVTGVILPPDLGTFLTQASQQGFNPIAFTVGKGALFPVTIEALPNDLGVGVTSEIWWTPSSPFTSSLTKQTARELADAYTEATGKQWTMPIGFAHSLFEVAVNVLQRAENIDDPESIVEALKTAKVDTIVGSLSWEAGPFPNVAKTPLVGGQWQPSDKYKVDLIIGTNTTAPFIPTDGTIVPKVWP